MSHTATDRNLLFGTLALQMQFITRDQLVAGLNAWVLDKTRTLGRIMVAQQALREDLHDALENLVEKHVALHENDPQRCLETLSSFGSARGDLAGIADADVQASLAKVPARDAEATRSVVGAPSSGTRFRVLRPHARGGLGQVSVAEDTELHREVALKEVQDRFADNPAMRTRFLVEAEITGGLEHPGIVPVYGLGCYANGRPFYAMRFIRGDSLKEAIERFHRGGTAFDGIDFRRLLGRFVDVCNALAYAHSRGVVHRDLKPANIMLGRFGETLVVDWGLAKTGAGHDLPSGAEGVLQPPSLSGTHETVAGTAVGTAAYMSPEQAAGRLDQVGPASDVYSLGATLYVLLTGRVPFANGDAAEVMRRVRHGEFLPPRSVNVDIPLPLYAVCRKAMALDPHDRYASALELAADIEHWLADEAVSAWPEPRRVKVGRWMRRHQALVSGAVAALLVGVLAATAGIVWYQNERARRIAQQEYLNQEVRAALDDLRKTRAAIAERLNDPLQVYDWLSDLEQWHVRLATARAAWQRAQTLAQANPVLLNDDLAQGVADTGLALDRDERELAQVRELDRIRLEAFTLVEGKFNYARAAQRYPECFTHAGLPPDEPAGWAGRIRGSPARYALVAALDHWASVTADAGLQDRLLATARLADPHPWRDHFRDGAVWRDRAALERLARDFKPEEHAPQTALALAARLHAGGADPLPVLRAALLYHPREFWLFFDRGCYATDPAEKLGCCQAARALRPQSAAAHINLGVVLRDQKDPRAAARQFARALEVEPDNSLAHLNLGTTLHDQKDLDGAIREFRRSIQLDPNYARAHYNLGIVLRESRDLDGAITAYRKAVELDPALSVAHNNLGNALAHKRDLPGAIKHMRKAIELDPDNGSWHYNLGNFLRQQKELPAAIEEYRIAVKLKPDHVNANGALSQVLLATGRFAEARQATLVVLKLWPAAHPGRPAMQQQLRQCDSLLTLDARLAAYRKTRQLPESAADRLALADLCRRYKRDHATAATLYASALDGDSPVGDDVARLHRYDAARSALAAASTEPMAAVQQQLRGQALAWLQTDLRLMTRKFQTGPAQEVLDVAQRLSECQSDPETTPWRDPKTLAELPATEQQPWRDLWSEADALAKRVRSRIAETVVNGSLDEKQRARAYDLKLRVGTTYVIEMHSAELDSFLKLLDSRGKLLAEDDDIAADNPDARLIFAPKADATFRVIATSFDGAGRGDFTLIIRSVAAKR